MPKLKTHKGAAARLYVTGSGRLMRRHRMSSHLRRKKPKKVTRKYLHKLSVDRTDVKRLSRLLPYR